MTIRAERMWIIGIIVMAAIELPIHYCAYKWLELAWRFCRAKQ